MALLASIINVFLSPTDAFQGLQDRDTARTRTTLLLILAGLGLVNLVALKDLYMNVQYDQTVQRIENSDRISDEQKQEMLENIDERFSNPSTGQLAIMWITNAVGFPLRVIFMAFIVLVIGNFVFGGNLKYGDLITMTALTYMISLLELAVKIPLMNYKWSIEVYTGLGLLGLGEPGSFIRYFTNSLDIFALWRVIVLGIGAAILYKKKSTVFISAFAIYFFLQITVVSSLGAIFSP